MRHAQAVVVFLVLTFAWSWGLLGGFLALDGSAAEGGKFFSLLIAYTWGPGIAALFVQHFMVKAHPPRSLGLGVERSTWIVAAWFLPALIALLVLGLDALWPGMRVSFTPTELLARDIALVPAENLEEAQRQAAEAAPWLVFFSQFSGALLFGTLLLGFVLLGQELGWRGFLLKEAAGLGFWKSSLLVGVVSGIWYAPLAAQSDVYPEHPVLGAVVMGLFLVLLSPIASWLRLRAGSLVAAAVFLGGLQAFSRLVHFFTIGGSDLTRGLYTLPGLVVMGAGVVLLLVKKAPGVEEPLERLSRIDEAR